MLVVHAYTSTSQEAEIRRIMVQSQFWQNSSQGPISKNQSQQRAGGMVQGVGSKFKPRYCNNNNNNKKTKT
jgi:hypothetical protein